MAEGADDKSLDPTPQRRQQLRQAGHVAHSHELTSAAVLLGGVTAIAFMGSALVEHLAGMLRSQLGGQGWQNWLGADAADSQRLASDQWSEMIGGLGQMLLPCLGLASLCAVGVTLAQTRFLFMPRKAMGDFSRVNPLAGLARLMSWSSVGRLGFSAVKLCAIVGIAAATLYPRSDELLSISSLDLPGLATLVWELCWGTCVKIALSIAGLAALDYGYQRWKFERDARMSPQEMREEMRNLQGDPQGPARRRALHRQMAESQGVRRADVVVSAPGGVAVALRYDAATMRAPQVVAKAQGASGLQWRRVASEHQIPWLDRAQLAEALHRQTVVNRPVADALFVEVADALAVAYQQRRAATAR